MGNTRAVSGPSGANGFQKRTILHSSICTWYICDGCDVAAVPWLLDLCAAAIDASDLRCVERSIYRRTARVKHHMNTPHHHHHHHRRRFFGCNYAPTRNYTSSGLIARAPAPNEHRAYYIHRQTRILYVKSICRAQWTMGHAAPHQEPLRAVGARATRNGRRQLMTNEFGDARRSKWTLLWGKCALVYIYIEMSSLSMRMRAITLMLYIYARQGWRYQDLNGRCPIMRCGHIIDSV